MFYFSRLISCAYTKFLLFGLADNLVWVRKLILDGMRTNQGGLILGGIRTNQGELILDGMRTNQGGCSRLAFKFDLLTFILCSASVWKWNCCQSITYRGCNAHVVTLIYLFVCLFVVISSALTRC